MVNEHLYERCDTLLLNDIADKIKKCKIIENLVPLLFDLNLKNTKTWLGSFYEIYLKYKNI